MKDVTAVLAQSSGLLRQTIILHCLTYHLIGIFVGRDEDIPRRQGIFIVDRHVELWRLDIRSLKCYDERSIPDEALGSFAYGKEFEEVVVIFVGLLLRPLDLLPQNPNIEKESERRKNSQHPAEVQTISTGD